MEVESASRVVDGAVVLIDSVEGVEAQTKGVWRQLSKCIFHKFTRLILTHIDHFQIQCSHSHVIREQA